MFEIEFREGSIYLEDNKDKRVLYSILHNKNALRYEIVVSRYDDGEYKGSVVLEEIYRHWHQASERIETEVNALENRALGRSTGAPK